MELPDEVFFFMIFEELGLFAEDVLPIDGLDICILSPE